MLPQQQVPQQMILPQGVYPGSTYNPYAVAPQQQPQSQGMPPLGWPPKMPENPSGANAPMSAEQYHVAMLQHQLQQTQVHAQAQAQLLALYQQQQQQQQLQSAMAAYHGALMQAQAQAQYNPVANMYANMNQAAAYANAVAQAQSAAQQHNAALAAAANSNSAPQNNVTVTVGHVAPAPANHAELAPAPTDARIHSTLAGTAVEWVPLPPRYVMDSVAKTAAATKLATNHSISADYGDHHDENSDKDKDEKLSGKTVFIGGISYDVARDPRVLPWLAAAMCRRPVVVRKVIPHKERRAKHPASGDASAPSPKLALSAFAVIDADDVDHLIETLHHRVLWDIGGCWIARTPEAIEQLRDYTNAQCTWQRREAGAAAGLPRHMMTVESATAVGSANHAATHAHRGSMPANVQRGHNVMSIAETVNCQDHREEHDAPTPQSALVSKVPLLPEAFHMSPPPPAHYHGGGSVSLPVSEQSAPLRLDWGMLHTSYRPIHDEPRSDSPKSSDGSSRSGAVGDHR